MAATNNEFLTQAENQATPWLPPQNNALFNSAYESPTGTTGNAALTSGTGNAAIATAAQSGTQGALTGDQAAQIFSSLGQTDMQAFYQALTPADQQTLGTAISSPNLTQQALSTAFSQLDPTDLQNAFSSLPDIQTVLQNVAANPAGATADATNAVTPGSTGDTTALASATPGQTPGADTTTQSTAGSMSPTQEAVIFSQLPSADMQTFATSLNAQDQGILSQVIQNPNASMQDLVTAFGQMDATDLSTAFSAVPSNDLQAATTAAAQAMQGSDTTGGAAATTGAPTDNTAAATTTGAPTDTTPQAGTTTGAGSDMSSQLANLTPDQITKILGALPNDTSAFMNALPQADQTALQNAVSAGGQNPSEATVSAAIGQLPQADVLQALAAIPAADLQKALQEIQGAPAPAKAGTDAPPTTAGADPTAPADHSGSWVKWGLASLGAGYAGGAVAYRKFDLGAKLPDSVSSKLDHLPFFKAKGAKAAADAGRSGLSADALAGTGAKAPDSVVADLAGDGAKAPGSVVADLAGEGVKAPVVVATDGLANATAATGLDAAEQVIAKEGGTALSEGALDGGAKVVAELADGAEIATKV